MPLLARLKLKLVICITHLTQKFTDIERLRLEDIQRLELQRASDLKAFRDDNASLRNEQTALGNHYSQMVNTMSDLQAGINLLLARNVPVTAESALPTPSSPVRKKANNKDGGPADNMED